MCVSHYGYEPKFLVRDTEERLNGVKVADAEKWRQALASVAARWIARLADDARRLAGLKGASA
jgi:hypothetical protein